MRAFFGSIYQYFARRPQSRLSLLRTLLYVGFAISAKVALDADTLFILLAGVLGVGDLASTASGNTGTTPVTDPRLGAGKPMPPELRAAALAVQTFLPGPIGELWKRYGELMWGLVDTARKRQLTEAEGKAAVEDEIAKRTAR